MSKDPGFDLDIKKRRKKKKRKRLIIWKSLFLWYSPQSPCPFPSQLWCEELFALMSAQFLLPLPLPLCASVPIFSETAVVTLGVTGVDYHMETSILGSRPQSILLLSRSPLSRHCPCSPISVSVVWSIKSSSIKWLLPVQCLPTPTGDETQDLAHAKQELHPAPSSMT